MTDRSIEMGGLEAAVLTYALASLFAIVGMGAAGVLIPNYIMLGLAVRTAIIAALTQNVAELFIVTLLNASRGLVEWRKVATLSGLAIVAVPLGYLIHVNIPIVAVLLVFEMFLLYALFTISNNRARAPPSRYKSTLPYLLASLQGLIAGLIGMDAAPIAIIAYSKFYHNPKRVASNTAATALFVSTTALICYSSGLIGGSGPGGLGMLMLPVAVAGALGGITGARLMHSVKPVVVKKTLATLLVLASLEVYIKIIYASVNSVGLLFADNIILGSWIG